MERRIAAIMAADMVGFSRLIENDEAGTLTRQKQHRLELIEPTIRQYNGRIIKLTGDGFIAEFSSVVEALQAAVKMQREMTEREAPAPEIRRIRYRVAIHLGDVVVDDADIYGDGVNVAARLETLAEPGGIVVSGIVRDMLKAQVEVGYRALGEKRLKNIDKPVRVYEVTTTDAARARLMPFRISLRSTTVSVLGVVASLVLAGLFFWSYMTSANRVSGTDAPRVAVLPLETLDQTVEHRWLGDGISDDIVAFLSRFREFQVLSRESSFRYASGAPDHTAIRRELGADFLVAGRVAVTDDRVFLTLRLIETENGSQVWTQKYEGPYQELLSIREAMLQRVAAQLSSAARAEIGARVASHSPSDLKAYELVLRGWRAYYQFNKAATQEGEALADRAIALDPDYAPAFSLRARLLIQFYVQPYDNRRGDTAILDAALMAAQRAVSLDPRSAENLAWLGNVFIWKGEHDQALRDIERAVALNPGNASIWFIYADGLSRAGRQRDALEAWSEIRRLDVASPPLNNGLEARSHLLLGDSRRAYELTSECLRYVPKLLPCNLFHIMAATEMGREDEIKASVEVVRDIAPRFTVSGWRDIIRFGDEHQADRLSAWLIAAGLTP